MLTDAHVYRAATTACLGRSDWHVKTVRHPEPLIWTVDYDTPAGVETIHVRCSPRRRPETASARREARVMRVCAAGLLLRDGRVLLGLRAPDRNLSPSTWDIFGGHLEPGESPADALRRELQEEIHVTPTEFEQIATLEEPAREPRLEAT